VSNFLQTNLCVWWRLRVLKLPFLNKSQYWALHHRTYRTLIMHEYLFTRHKRMCATHVWSFLICHTQSKLTVWTAIIRSTCVSTRRSAANTRVVTFAYDHIWFCSVYSLPTGILRLPWLRFFRDFSSVVRQMPLYTSQRRGTVRTLPN